MSINSLHLWDDAETVRGVRNLIPMDYLEEAGGDLVKAMRAYSAARWRLIERLRAAEAALTDLEALLSDVAPEYAESTVAANARAVIAKAAGR